MAKPRELLILKYEDLRRETSHFFTELNNDDAVRDLFFTNPSLVIRTKFQSLSGIPVLDQHDEIANRILYSVLANERFKEFLRGYQQKKNAALARLQETPEDREASEALDERTIRLEMADALLQYGDRELMASILDGIGSAQRSAMAPWSPFVIWALLIAVVVAIHTLLALGTSGDFAPTFRGRSPIPASEMRKIAEQLVAAARRAREAGQPA